MPFIGNKPSAVPLTSADIADSIITSAKIVDGTIVNSDISTTSAITLNKLSGNPSFRNIVINGDMQVAQRNTSVASITTSGYYTLDRWQLLLNSLGTWTMSQSTDVPSGYGFAKSLKLDCTTADASPSAGDYVVLSQGFEGQNLQYLKKGTANAVSLTASFWVKSTKTGTFILVLYDAYNIREISKSYTVNVSNTWEFKTITFAGDTTGAFTNTNDGNLYIQFWLGAGSTYTSGTLNTSWSATALNANTAAGQVNIADSTANDFLITGVQLEAGTSATDFEFLPIDVSLGRCQRYYEKFLAETVSSCISNTCMAIASTLIGVMIKTTQRMRAIPTGNFSGTITVGDGTANYNLTSLTLAGSQCSTYMAFFNGVVASGLTTYRWYRLEATAGTDFVELSAEL